jgi:hypothetical protein
MILAGSVVTTLMLMERLRPVEERSTELSYLPKGEYLKVAVLGYQHITADLIWLKTVQYLGDMKQTTGGFRWAYHAADVVTDLDPAFVMAYYAGGTVLGVWSGLMDESNALLEKGMRYDPNDWRFPFLIGYNYFYEMCDSRNGSRYFQLAASLPQAPPYLANLSARLAADAGDPEAAVEFLFRFRNQVADPRVKEGIEVRIKEVIVERDIKLIDDAVIRFKAQKGSLPLSFEELVELKFLKERPEEPFGGQYLLLPSGNAASSKMKDRLRAYRKINCSHRPSPVSELNLE